MSADFAINARNHCNVLQKADTYPTKPTPYSRTTHSKHATRCRTFQKSTCRHARKGLRFPAEDHNERSTASYGFCSGPVPRNSIATDDTADLKCLGTTGVDCYGKPERCGKWLNTQEGLAAFLHLWRAMLRHPMMTKEELRTVLR